MEFQFSEEEQMLRTRVKSLAEEKIAPLSEAEESETIALELKSIMAEAELFKLFAPEEYGGTGIRSVFICIAREELSKVSNHADDIFATLGLGTLGISFSGTEAQKTKHLPRVARGEVLGSFALTEPNAGSDVAGIQATAKLDGEHYFLNGEKIFPTCAGMADIWLVFAKTDPAKGRKGISAFIVEPNSVPGIHIESVPIMAGPPEFRVTFSDVPVPKDNLVGMEGDGWQIALASLNIMRVTVGAVSLGIAQAAFEEALSYAQKRIAFGQPIIDFQAIQFKLADMATEIEAARWLVYRAAYLRDSGMPRPIKYASMAKLFATEVAWRVADEAVQIHGGYGLCKGVKVERLLRAARLPRIYEGTSEIQRLTIARELMREMK